jgi:hypothetical protein
MSLPFTRSEFLAVFGAYNGALWPAAVVLWIVSLGFGLLLVRGSKPPDRALSALLAVHWGWSAIAYHALFFSAVNPAAWLFAGLFLAEAAIVARLGVFGTRLQFSTGRSIRHLLGHALVLYALAYPFVVLTDGPAFPEAPTFGVPCPTTIFTIGILLTAESQFWKVIVIPVLWGGIGGSAAFLLGIRTDLVLLVAAPVLLGYAIAGTLSRTDGITPSSRSSARGAQCNSPQGR